ncbi:putative P-loop ATPase [Roseibium album]|nr:putative P-loop ATPase [Roseibium album]
MHKETPVPLAENGGSVSNANGPAFQGNDTGPAPEVNDAVNFLKWFRPEGPWVLTAIVPGGRITTTTFRVDQEKLLRDWLSARAGHENIYFQVNSTGKKNVTRKTRKSDIVAAEWLHVDIDPTGDITSFDIERKRILKKLREHSPPPSVIVDSGGGFQAFWRLSEPVEVDNPSEEAWADFERYNRQVEADLGGDHCHNVDRIMRLPGTINVPNKKKRAKGREPAQARVVSQQDQTFELSVFSQAPLLDGGEVGDVGRLRVQISDNLPRLSEIDELDQNGEVPQHVKMLCVQGLDPDKPGRYSSRSECFWYVVCELVRCKIPDEIIASVMLDPDFLISGHVLDQRNPNGYMVRQLQRAHECANAENGTGPQWDRVTKDGQPLPSFGNAQEALRHLEVKIWHDAFCDREMVCGHAVQDYEGVATDKALMLLREKTRQRWSFDPGKEHIRDAFCLVALENRHDPVVDMLDNLSWDGQERLETWMTRACGVPDTPYAREVGKLMLRAMCLRARTPGVKFDHMVILEGAQGAGKSLSLNILAGEWFSDAGLFSTSGDRDRAELLQGNWINEVAELDGLSKRDVTEVKRFITQTHDEYRAAYAHRKERRARRGILVGTTNDDQWNRDPTGARRFLPVRCGTFDLDWLRANRDQLLAEADTVESTSLILPASVWEAATTEQAARRADHSWDEFLAEMQPEERFAGKDRASTKYIIEQVLKLSSGEIARRDTARLLRERLRHLGWSGPKLIAFKGKRRAKGYWRETTEPDQFAPPEPPF